MIWLYKKNINKLIYCTKMWLDVLKFSVLRELGLKRPQNLTFFKNVKNQNLHFWIFSKIPSEMNSNDPFYPILIPNTPYVKFSLFFFLVVRGSRGSQKSLRFLPFTQKIFRLPILENSWLFPSFCCGCTYEEKKSKHLALIPFRWLLFLFGKIAEAVAVD